MMLAKHLPRLSTTALSRPQLHITRPLASRTLQANHNNIHPTSIKLQTRASTTTAHSTTEHKAGDGAHGHDAHESHYDPPGGWLWGIKPGEKYEKEGWEWAAWAFWIITITTGVAYAFKEDTSIQTWALEEARRRLEKEGLLPDPNPDWKPAEETE